MGQVEDPPAAPLFVLHEHSGAVLCCSFFPSDIYERQQSSWFLSGDVEGHVVVWNLMTRRPIASFSALEEAHRQILSSAATQGGQPPQTSADFAAFGPHSRSVIAVGFVPVTSPASSMMSAPAPSGGSEAGLETPSLSGASERAAATSVVAAPSASAGTQPAGPPRQRFRLTRRAPPVAHLHGESPSQETTQESWSAAKSICFYTHCRDQRVYVWQLLLTPSADGATPPTLRLMAALTAPQHGFCPAESTCTLRNGVLTTYLAVPHDANGEITVWELQWQPHEGHKATAKHHSSTIATSALSDETHRASSTESSAAEDSDDDDSVEEVDTEGMNPMDALIARAAAAERQEKRRLRKESKKTASSVAVALQNAPVSEPATVVAAKASRSSFLCYVASDATPSANGFSLRRQCSFSACQRFKGGTIMRLTMCRDAQHLAVAFESGHVVLARYRNVSPSSPAAQRDRVGDTSTKAADGIVRCAARAFAESALTCWWSGDRLLACSAEGGIHCYRVSSALDGVGTDAQPPAHDSPLQLDLVWSVTLRKGIGSVCLQANLVIAGCWDSTVRLYDARSGRLVSILSYQKATINDTRIAPQGVARVAAFGFDARQPRSYAAARSAPVASTIRCLDLDSQEWCASRADEAAALHSPPEEEEELVYLFCSASKDGSVALWRVDMQLLSEQAALRIAAA